MLIGHFAVGFASKRLAPRVSLATLVAAPLFLDILFPIFILTGVEHARLAPGITQVTPMDLYDYPWSHSLLMSIVWSIVFGGVYYLRKRDRAAALVLLAIYLGGVLGPPPPSLTPVAIAGLVANLLFFWIAWFDRHREPKLASVH